MQKYTRGFRAFTLIELMVVISIVAILSAMTYFPYAHHQKKVLLQQGVREIAQSISQARNLAIHGLDTGSGNLNVALFIPENTQEIYYYTSLDDISLTRLGDAQIYRQKNLPRGVQTENQEDILFVFSAISGSGRLYPAPTSSRITIESSYRGAESGVLRKTLTYYPETYISDY